VSVLSKGFASLVRSRLPRVSGWLAGSLIGCWAMAGHAASPCEVAHLPDQPPDAILSALRLLEPQCHKHAPFLYRYGLLLNQAGRYDQAIDLLEGALLYRPEHWPSQLEYAIALEGVGDHPSAQGLLQNLANNPGLDLATRQQILALLQRQAPDPAAPRHGTISLATGYDDNLLGSTYHTEFDLTTAAGTLPVQLDPSQRPVAGAFVQTEISYANMLFSQASSPWHYNLQGSLRSSPDENRANQVQWGALLERSALAGDGLYMQAQYQALQRADSTNIKQIRLGIGYEFNSSSRSPCGQRAGFDLQQIDYPQSPAQNGRYTGVISHTNCPAWGLQVQMRAGRNQPEQDNRPGGLQHEYSLRFSQNRQTQTGYLSLELEATRQQDQSGYSPLLSNNEPRQLSRMAYRLQYRWLAGFFSPFIGFEWLDQRANLPLFELSNRVLTLGVRSNW
jgi:hypothetical protein